jgi:hypothetical protein
MCLVVPAFAQTASNNFGASANFGGTRGFTSYTFRNPQGSNNPTFPNPASPLPYNTNRGGVSAFANQINNTPNTSIPSYSGTSGQPTTASNSTSAGYSGVGSASASGLSNTTLNLTPSSGANSILNTNPSSNNAGFNNAGTQTTNTTGIINGGSGLR